MPIAIRSDSYWSPRGNGEQQSDELRKADDINKKRLILLDGTYLATSHFHDEERQVRPWNYASIPR